MLATMNDPLIKTSANSFKVNALHSERLREQLLKYQIKSSLPVV